MVNKSKRRTWFYYYWQSLSGRIGLILLAILILGVLCSLFHILPYGPLSQDPNAIIKGPSWHHIFGTDQFGRDIFSRVLDGLRRSLSVSVVAVLLATLLGLAIGVTAGYFGGILDTIAVRMSDIFFAFPAILLALAIVSALGHTWIDTSLAIAIVYTPIFVRVTRGPVLSLKELD